MVAPVKIIASGRNAVKNVSLGVLLNHTSNIVPPASPQSGFTLVEIVAVLIILSLMAALAVPRFIELDENASQRAIDAGISELNSRESLTWTVVKTTGEGWQSDAELFLAVNYDLGSDYTWSDGPANGEGAAEGGGILSFQQGFNAQLGRIDSSLQSPARWYRK